MTPSRGVTQGVELFLHAVAAMENRKLFEPFVSTSHAHPDHHQCIFVADHASIAGSIWQPGRTEAGDGAGFITLAWAISHLQRCGIYAVSGQGASAAETILRTFLPTAKPHEPWGFAASTSGYNFDPQHLWKAIRAMPAGSMTLHESVGAHIARFDYDMKVVMRAKLKTGVAGRALETDNRTGPVYAGLLRGEARARGELEHHRRDWRAIATFSSMITSLKGNGANDLGQKLEFARMTAFEEQQRAVWNQHVEIEQTWADLHISPVKADDDGVSYRIPAPAALAQKVAARHNLVAAMAKGDERKRGAELASRTAHAQPSPGVSRAPSLEQKHGFRPSSWAKAVKTIVTAGVTRAVEQDMSAATAHVDPHLRYKVVHRT